MKDEICYLAVLLALLLLPGCKDEPAEKEGPVRIGEAQVWLTRGDKSTLFQRQTDLLVMDSLITNHPVVRIDTSATMQEIEGFGAALTGSSAYLLHQKLDPAARAANLRDLFDPAEGIGISYLRLTMGASDFSLSDYTYNDLPAGQTDFELQQFSLARDLDDVVPVLKEIIEIAPDIRLMGSPWSPPAWMKTNGGLKGGKLKPEFYEVYAAYFVRYVQAMANQGIIIDAVTPQNEPLHFTAGYPCMEMQPEEQGDFIKNHLGPAFQQAGISTKIIIYDHNWDDTQYPISILNDAAAAQYIAGSAFHAYAGDVSAMSTVHNVHPDKGLYFTEISGGGWAVNFSDNLMWYMDNILIGTTRNWSKTALFWNLALNQANGPQNNGCSDCRGVITINSNNGMVVKNEEYYALAHFSKFVRPGAVRVSITIPQLLANMGIVSFLNPDGSKVLVACNHSAADRTFSAQQETRYFTATVPAKSVVTIIW
ncbi:MAG: glycoside hydrolase family 30 beta sandwich domain-containing protein [Bacteroidales bacterium]|jgi:glucosylceramidase|nr:glycoside hydrolase family 30 beta sandwich domain-containing protein [Bacteroidales bacterium]